MNDTDGETQPTEGTTIAARQLAPVTAAYAITTLWLAALGLVTTPYLLHRLGASAYAVFALINLIVAYISNLEFGFGHGTVRFLARARAEGDRQAEARVLGTGLLVFLAAATIGGLLVLFGAPLIVRDFAHFPASIEDAAVVAIRLGAVVIAATFLMNFFTAALQVYGRFPVLIKTRLAFGTLLSAGAVVATALFTDIRAVLVAQVIVVVSYAVVLVIALVRVPGVKVRPTFHSPTFKIMGGFSLVILLTGLASQVEIQGPPTVLAGDAPSAELAVFAVPALVLQQLLMLAGAASVGFLPFASGQSADTDRTHLSAVFNSHVRLTLLTMGAIAGFLVVFAEPLLATWIGPGFASHAATPLRLLAVVSLFLALTVPAADVARGLGKPSWTLAHAAGSAAIGIAVSIPAVHNSGAKGAALGLLAALAATTPVLVVAVATRLLGQDLLGFVRRLLRPSIAVALATLAWWGALRIDDGFLMAVVAGAIVIVVYLVLVWRAVLDQRERDTLASGFGGLRANAGALIRRPGSVLRVSQPS